MSPGVPVPASRAGPGEDDGSAAQLLRSLEEIDLDRYTIVGRYARFDPRLRASLDELRQRVVAAMAGPGGRPQNFLLWGPPGSGKSYLVQQIASTLGPGARFLELNLSQVDEASARSGLLAAIGLPGPLLVFVDELDARPDATWPYELLLTFLEPPTPRSEATAFLLAGSGGGSPTGMRERIGRRPKGPDLLSRIPRGNGYRVDPLGVGDRMLVAAVQFREAAESRGHHLRDVEKLALYFVAASPAFASARQLRALADQTAQRIPPGESRLRYDHLFRPGDPENKRFWTETGGVAGDLAEAYVRLRPATSVIPAALGGPSLPPTPPTPRVEPPRPRVAVLPFRNISPDPADAYLAEGLAEELLAALGRLPGLDLVSRSSVSRYGGENRESAREIGRALNATALLDGSVRKAGHRLRITAQFTEAAADRQVWGETFDGDIADVFGMQEAIATKVAHALADRLQGSLETPRRPPPPVEAYLDLLKGRAALREGTREAMERAIALFEEALAVAPEYPDALAGISTAYARLGYWEMAPSREALAQAKAYAERALRADPTLVEARLRLASFHRAVEFDYATAEREFRQVVELRPRSAEAHASLSSILMEAGRTEEAVREAKLAMELEPESSWVHEGAGIALLYGRRYADAVAALRIARELDPRNTVALHNLGLGLVQLGEVEEGVAALESAIHLTKLSGPLLKMELAYGYLRGGRAADAESVLRELLDHASDGPGWVAATAGIYANTGRIPEALDALERAGAERVPFLGAHLRVDFIFDPLRGEPRFRAVLDRLTPGSSPGRSGPGP